MSKRFCDLHTHTLYSDGTYTPTELIEEAEKIGLSYIALTDHNNTKGIPEFLKAAEGKNVNAIAGIEFSTDYKDKELHIIALHIKEEDFPIINRLVDELKKRKEESVKNLISALSKDGYSLDYEKIKASSGGQVNRAHIAVALYEKGYTDTVRGSFGTLLSPDGKYYKRPPLLPVFEVIEFIRSIGAVSILAHPFLNLTELELREFLPLAKAAGLDAMETVYTTYSKETAMLAKSMANEYGLKESGGSDFHGPRKPDTFLAVGKGDLFVPAEFAENLNPNKKGMQK